jgi:hypothetical protein
VLDVGTAYLVTTGALLAALAIGIRALVDVSREGRERSRRRRAREIERDTKDPVSDGEPPDSDADAAARSTYPQCGAENDSSFAFCRAAPLGPRSGHAGPREGPGS